MVFANLMKLTRQTVDEEITPILNYIFKLNLAEEGAMEEKAIMQKEDNILSKVNQLA